MVNLPIHRGSFMTWNYTYTASIWPSVLTVLLLIALAIYSARRRSVPGALPFLIGCLFAAAWAAGNVMEVAASDLAAMIFWFKFQAVWQLPLIIAVACFVLEYTWPRRWLTRRNLVLLSLPALVILGLILTNDLHHLVWRGFVFDGKVIPLRGLGNWIVVAYGYGLTLGNLIILSWLFRRSPQHRWPAVIMVTGQILGRGLYLLQAAQLLQSDLSLSVLAVTAENSMYAIALFGFRIFDPISLARQTTIEQLKSGMLVLDPQGAIVSLNPAAAAILGAPAKSLLGCPIQDLLLASSALFGDLQASEASRAEISLEVGSETRCYQLEVSPLKDWRGLGIGRLLLLHDMTEQKRAQAQLLEQQRALAMLHEREQLARELHDSLGQAFAFVNTQGQTIRRLLSRGDIATADEYTSRLVAVAREADVDIRESILGLRVALSGQGFFPVLAKYLTRYEKNYAIHTELKKPDTMLDGTFEPLVEVQLLRILQEALTNIRKHAGAHRVRISFVSEAGCGRITIQDDGQGFDPQAQSDSFNEHVGLRVMRERAEEVGGHLLVDSNPGQGTRVIVEVPVNSNR
jgi:PAS domain S-box-containing protein